jgi:hypothetical protein
MGNQQTKFFSAQERFANQEELLQYLEKIKEQFETDNYTYNQKAKTFKKDELGIKIIAALSEKITKNEFHNKNKQKIEKAIVATIENISSARNFIIQSKMAAHDEHDALIIDIKNEIVKFFTKENKATELIEKSQETPSSTILANIT